MTGIGSPPGHHPVVSRALAINVAVLLSIIMVACDAESALTSPVTTPADTTPAVVTTTTIANATSASTTTIVAVDAAPDELSGTWTTQVGSNEVALTLRGDRYTITRGSASGSGMISVVGDQITFSGSSLCSGVGTYTWSVDGETLTFEASDPMDPCSGRTSVLLGVVFTKG
jgi:hypothetical protein